MLELLITTLSSDLKDTPPSAVKLTFSTVKLLKEPMPSSYPVKLMFVESATSILCADIIINVESDEPGLKTISPNRESLLVAAIKKS